ncbi:AAA family ATPase [Aerosakkonema funiforme]|uniref:Uncharacterized AAA domain-containing protein ycf46 n=2 Tax=Oscillatoriophycideae TaxID=1301283 RepID=A0A926ZL06_9CYAN|nr:AAA family ATPase [Aerosakkonema funiforme]MBD2185902.1 AAA family ATPase [Aerosakkonema funiforme FACHB-1375]
MDWQDLDLLIETVKVVSIQCSAIEQPNTLKWIDERLAVPRKLPVYVWNYGQEVFEVYGAKLCQKVWDKFQPINDCLIDLVNFLLQCEEPGIFVVENLQFFLNIVPQTDSLWCARALKINDKLRTIFNTWRLSQSPKYLILLSTMGVDLPSHLVNLIPELWKPLPKPEEIFSIANEVLNEESVDKNASDINTLTLAASGLTEEEIKTGLRLGLKRCSTKEKDALFFLLQYKINLLRSLNLEFIPKPEVNSFGGLDLLKKAFIEVKNKYSPEARASNLPLPKGCLLVGPPGTGKSRALKACAVLLDFPLVMLDVGTIVAGGLKFLKEVLRRVEALEPCVIGFDEFDKLFAASNNSGEDIANRQILGTLLTWLQEKKSKTYVIATLNRLKSLPPELTRAGRFDRKFYVGLPQAIERKEIIQLHASRYDSRYDQKDGPLTESEWRTLLNTSTVNFSGGELEAIVERAVNKIFQQALAEKHQTMQAGLADAVTPITFKINAADLIEAASSIHSLYSIDPDRIIAIQNQSKYFCEPSSSPDSSKYAPPIQTFWGQPISVSTNLD